MGSKNPKLEASQEWRSIMIFLKETDQASFKYWITDWYQRWNLFLAEKTTNPMTGKKSFTHMLALQQKGLHF